MEQRFEGKKEQLKTRGNKLKMALDKLPNETKEIMANSSPCC